MSYYIVNCPGEVLSEFPPPQNSVIEHNFLMFVDSFGENVSIAYQIKLESFVFTSKKTDYFQNILLASFRKIY